MKNQYSTFALVVSACLYLAPSAHAAPLASGDSSASMKSRLSEVQLAEVRTRSELANEILRNVSDDAQSRGLDESWRTNLLSVLYNTPSGALRDIAGAAKTLAQAQSQAVEARSRTAAVPSGRDSLGAAIAVGNGLGSSIDDFVFTPMAPCRFIDTRFVGGPIGTTPRSFDTSESGPTYGGTTGCKLPGIGEPAIAVNATIASPSVAAGYVSIRPVGSSNVTSWLNWHQIGEVKANAGIITTDANSSFHYAFEVLAGAGSTHFVLDYFGYFTPVAPIGPSCTSDVSETITVPVGYQGVISGSKTCRSPAIAVGAHCSNNNNPHVSFGGARFSKIAGSDVSECVWSNQSGVDAPVVQGLRCCEVP